VESFARAEERLTWASLFFSDFPNADVYLVGGALRDALLGILPTDIDIVIRNVEIKDLHHWLTRHGACELVEKRFGTLKFIPHGQGGTEPIDITLPRKEWVEGDHASTRRSLAVSSDPRLSIKDDLSRRDFTMNAMAFDLRRNTLLDPYGGLQDIQNGLIRTVLSPHARFYEDATRMLRALRFASQLSFGIEAGTWQALKENIHLINNQVLTENGTHRYTVARESIGREFLLGLTVHPAHTLDVWNEAGALRAFLPDVHALQSIVEPDGETAYQKTRTLLELLKRPSLLAQHGLRQVPATLLAAALTVFAQEEKEQRAYHICKDLYFHQFASGHHARVDCEELLWLMDHVHDFESQDPASLRPSEFERLYCSERGKRLLILMHATAIASKRHTPARERIHTARTISQRFCAERPEELITGHDIEALGIPPGPVYRELMDRVRDNQLLNQISTKQDAIHILKEHS